MVSAQHTQSLGKYPKVSPKDARGSARDILSDPGKVRRKEQGTEVAYAEAVERYLELKAAELSTNTWALDAWIAGRTARYA